MGGFRVPKLLKSSGGNCFFFFLYELEQQLPADTLTSQLAKQAGQRVQKVWGEQLYLIGRHFEKAVFHSGERKRSRSHRKQFLSFWLLK